MYPPHAHSPYFDPDTPTQWTYAMRVEAARNEHESPTHRHRMGQLVLSLQGGVTSFVPQGLWMVPPRCGVWIPGGVPHSNRVTDNGRVCFLFVPADTPGLPTQCCTLAITPLVREMVAHLADLAPADTALPANRRLAAVLIEQLTRMPTEQLHLPLSDHPRLREIAASLRANPADRSTAAEWGRRLAMSERTLARLVRQEVGMSFGRWRQQMHIVMALQRLSSGVSVQRTAEDLGYESVSAFITMFRKTLGQTPARYFADKA
ncbi:MULTISPECIES: AraC family transcriptional regulator [Achromobacter]|uniref:HTH-type transcriptional regulator NimR n=2 Tax=Achromobacter TaxID=222 RepID=A0A1D8IF52_9BURK|nr:helix-turn-helix transcriptional regulator [Achromobacter ruhlandii]ALX85920.1 AraC family transcriptional regulator [Achromobacter denitrificans]AMG45095.1 AraC family transcriptional regulator [Achromobacter xylosoxidans]AOU95060.1 AraC family transcriptional regulator [Achromobacter ruhlandii]MCV6795021.1 helix-turn-helix transcriptional regulator [Achromobacter ruhlandii]MCV6806295.1 helix-turn-helix transcriptional regulator [Achromobacter ruhlandii]